MMPITENLNIRIDPLLTLSYYEELKKNHIDSKWSYKNYNPYIPENSNYDNMVGCGILDSTQIPSKIDSAYFGYGQKIIDFFNFPSRSCISVVQPGSHLSLHVDNGVKIHIPLTDSKECYFFDEYSNYIPITIGSVYLLHTNRPHGMKYEGHNNRAHIIISCDEKYLDTIYSKKGMSCV